MALSNESLWKERYAGWLLIIGFCAVVIIQWLLIAPLDERFFSLNSTFSSIGKVAGLIGFVLYAINLVLSLRQRWLENLFGGLNRVYIAHHLTGGIALVMLLFHPIFLALVYIQFEALETLKEAANFLLPRTLDFEGSIAQLQQDTAINNGIIAFIGMVVLLYITFFVKLPYRIWLFTHKFLGLAFMFAGLHVILISSDVSRDPFLKTYMLMWIIIGISAFIYRSLLGGIIIRREPYEVVQVWQQPKNVVAVSLKNLDKNLDFVPGQFVFIRFLWSAKDGVNNEFHPFSIASAPGEQNLQLYMKSLGDYTTSLKNLQPGTVAEIEGAYGKFSYTRYSDRPQIWVAGGIGITPFLSMARSFGDYSPATCLIYSVVERSELIQQDILSGYVPTNHRNFRYVPFVSKENNNAFLNADIIEQMSGGLLGKEIFICGPPPMMKSIRKQLRKKGVKNSNIHTEEFSMS